MRIVFMGTPDFAVPTLRALAEGHQIVSVYSRPDAASGRGSRERPCAVKQVALELGLKVVQPPTLRDPVAVRELAGLRPDLCVVAAFGMILPREVLEVPRLGCVNVHASLLPRWRGAAPIQRAILSGDERTGVSIMQMEEGLDTGPVCALAETDVAEKDLPTLTAELGQLGARTLISILPGIEDGSVAWSPQDDAAATYAGKISKHEVQLEPGLTVVDAFRRIRASGPSAPARLRLGDIGVTVLEASPVNDQQLAAGTFIRSKSAVHIGFQDGALALRRVKQDGKQAIDGQAWACGLRHTDGRWEAPE